jgi:hypothetical protein
MVIISLDQDSMGPSAVEAQSKARTRSAISPAPMMRLEDGVVENPWEPEVWLEFIAYLGCRKVGGMANDSSVEGAASVVVYKRQGR